MRCTRVEAWILGTYTVKFGGDTEPTTKPIMGRKWCDQEATVTASNGAFTFHWCDKHKEDPTCGAVIHKP